jgi:ABC-type Fe3+ transport system permease subunit
MTSKRQALAVAATVVLGLAIGLEVLAVVVLQSLVREYAGWHWWADPATYLILWVPALVAVVGVLLALRSRRY